MRQRDEPYTGGRCIGLRTEGLSGVKVVTCRGVGVFTRGDEAAIGKLKASAMSYILIAS
jgi:hypothetical protein